MRVDLIAHTPAPDVVCGQAAAACVRGKNASRSLVTALKSGHDSVAEHASFTFRIEGISRSCLAQLTRHRLASYSVESQRYCDTSSNEIVMPDSITEHPDLVNMWNLTVDLIRDFYEHAIEMGVSKEDARYLLPEGTTTSLVITMNARELRHFFTLRCCTRAQWEIRALAEEMLMLVSGVAPILFEGAGPACARGECKEAHPCDTKGGA